MPSAADVAKRVLVKVLRGLVVKYNVTRDLTRESVIVIVIAIIIVIITITITITITVTITIIIIFISLFNNFKPALRLDP